MFDANKCFVFNHHFDKDEFEAMSARFREERERARGPAGKCLVCQEEVPGRRGIKKAAVMHHHLFNMCKVYPWSKLFNGPK